MQEQGAHQHFGRFALYATLHRRTVTRGASLSATSIFARFAPAQLAEFSPHGFDFVAADASDGQALLFACMRAIITPTHTRSHAQEDD